MLETAGGATAATNGTNRVAYFNRLLKSHGGRLEAAGDAPPDLSDGAIDERIVETGAELHRIVRDELGDRPELHGIVDQIVARGDNALRQFRESDEERLSENPALVRDLEVIVKTDGSRPSFMIRNGAVDSTTSPVGNWQATLDAEAGPLQEAIASVGRIEILNPEPVHQGTGFLVQKNLIITNRHVLQVVGERQADGAWRIKPGAAIDFGREHRGIDTHNSRALKRVVFTGSREIDFYQLDHKKLDLALIEIEPVDGPAPLLVEEARDWAERDVPTFIIGYPGQPPSGAYVPDLLNQLFRSTYGFKRLAPGNVIASNYPVEPWTVAHDCTTLGGNSGSVVLVIGRDTVAAGLHYGGGRGATDDSSENWGHVLGKVLDQPGDGSDKTLRQHLEDFDVEIVDSLA